MSELVTACVKNRNDTDITEATFWVYEILYKTQNWQKKNNKQARDKANPNKIGEPYAESFRDFSTVFGTINIRASKNRT